MNELDEPDPDPTPDPFQAMFAEAAARMERLNGLLAQRPLSDVYGVVHPSGTGSGTGGGGEGEMTFMLTLRPWRKDGGTCQETKLLIRKDVPEGDLRGLMNTFSAHDVVHLKLRVLEEVFMEDCPDRRDALLVEIVNADFQDEELAQHARDLEKPKFYRDDYLGKLQLDRSMNWLVTRRWKGISRYKIHIHRDGETYDARQAWEKIQFVESRLDAIRQAIVEHLFDIYDSNWASLGELTPAQFVKKTKLQSVTVEPDGRVEVWFADGGLFRGHEIAVAIDADHQIKSADLAG